MSIAQKLYESGKITYMRTDSMNLSDDAIKSAGGFIESNYGANISRVENLLQNPKELKRLTKRLDLLI